MLSTPKSPEINSDTIKLQIGVIALTLASITSFFSKTEITSISASYHEDGWARNIFVGFLFAISAFMLAYNGFSKKEMILSKVAAIAAFGVAMFPCGCGHQSGLTSIIHYASAVAMFSILAYFCHLFRDRAISKGHAEALRRSKIYIACGITISASILLMVFDHISDGKISSIDTRLTFHCEQAGLIAFGVSWLTASKSLPAISSPNERLRPFS
ncbi:hypothetical protein HNP29_003972 [Pseudomonas alcaligenes]|nr:hypothetical protein [Pseudomonas alcaligenes]